MNKQTLINRSLAIANRLNLSTIKLEQELSSPKSFWSSIYNKLQTMEQRPKYDNLIEKKKYQKVLDKLLKTKITLTTAQANKYMNSLDGRYVLTVNKDLTVPVNDMGREFLFELLIKGFLGKDSAEVGSDTPYSIVFNKIKSIEIRQTNAPTKVIKNKNGAFFAFINTSDIDLTKYQVYKAIDNINIENCFIHSLSMCGVPLSKINAVKLSLFSTKENSPNHIRKTDIKKIAELINKTIVLYEYDKNNHLFKTQYNKAINDPINIAIYENHYFIYELTVHSKGKRRNKPLTSLALINHLFKEGKFIKGNMTKFVESSEHKDLKNHIYLDNIDNEQREITVIQNKKPVEANIFYADTETFVGGEKHELYLIGFAREGSDIVKITSCEDFNYVTHKCKRTSQVNEFLKDVSKNGKERAIVYFHNLKYDYHVLEPYLHVTNKCVKDGQVYSVEVLYNKCKIEFRDSFKIIPQALSKFNKMFNLPDCFSKQEAICYSYYCAENHNKTIKTNEYKKLLDNDNKLIFDKIMKNKKTFNPTAYYKEYLVLDCLVLKHGLNKFAKLLSDITKNKINMYEYLTISSIADNYFKKLGCYDGIFESCGNLRNYIGKAVYGGRVSPNKKYEKMVINKKLSDYDACSLYPSAIYRLCKDVGFPLGKAKLFSKSNLTNWKNMTYCVLTVKINKVNKNQQIPFISYKDSNGILQYTNEPIDSEIIIDKYTLEDYINFHQIEYEIVEGVYWNEGVTKKFGEEIEKLYSERLKYKKTNPAMAEVIKLMLNSAYGKTIMKKSHTKINIMNYDKEKIENYIYNNFNTLKSSRKINKKCYEVETATIDTTYNRGHIGCAILSYSKRIMNEVFNTANDNDIIIYYTDTDSIHLELDDVEKLEKLYNAEYNRELNGKQLTQFHTDFNLDGACSEIYSTKSIFLGKKCYVDVLESTDKNGDIITGEHVRLKGITVAGLNYTAKQYGGTFKMFEALCAGDEIEILLNPYDEDTGKNKVMFDFYKGGVKTRDAFFRTVKF